MKAQRTAWIDIKALRLSRGWLQQEAADRLGIARSHLSYLENGKCGFSSNMIAAIIMVFGVEYEDFYKNSEK